MANQNYSNHASRKANAAPKGGGTKDVGVGKEPAITFKPGPFKDPGSHQPRERAPGVTEVKTYAQQHGVGNTGQGTTKYA